MREAYPVIHDGRYGNELCPLCGDPADFLVAFDPTLGYRGVICQNCAKRLRAQVKVDPELKTTKRVARRRKPGEDQTDMFTEIDEE